MTLTIGLAGCGQLGGAIGRALLRTGFVRPEQLWIANRSGDRQAFAGQPGCTGRVSCRSWAIAAR